MRKTLFSSVILLLVSLLGCRSQAAEIRNTDDGKLRIDEQSCVDFYLENDNEGADPTTRQCLAIIGDQKPESVEAIEGVTSGGLYTYHVSGTKIRILRYETETRVREVLEGIDLDANHILSSGIRIGSTEEELKRVYDGNQEYFFRDYDMGGSDTRFYVLYGDWYERYLILFEVDATTGVITDISYELDV